MTHNIKAVIWDNDNTLVATAEGHFQKHQQTASKYGIDLTDSHRPVIAKNNGSQNWEWLKKDFGLDADKDTYLKAIDLFFMEYCKNIPLNSNIKESIDLLKDRKIPQVIMSNARRDSLKISTSTHHLEDVMLFIWGKEDYVGRKDTPETYKSVFEAICEMIGEVTSSQDIVFFDDDAHVIEAAHTFGLTAIHVGNGPNPQAPKMSAKNLPGTSAIPEYLKSLLVA